MIKIFVLLFVLFLSCGCVKDAKELYETIETKAKDMKYWRPVEQDQNTIITYIGFTLIQIMDLDEKSKVLTLSVWFRQIWKNQYLSWDPAQYGGIKSVFLPHSSMWLPDIVLFNNANGKFETQFPNKPILYYNGMVDWLSPAIFQSNCEIDVKYFPYDEQTCYLNFGSWTYNRDQVKIRHMKHLEALLERSSTPIGSERWNYLTNYSRKRTFEDGVFLMNYYKSGEWDLMQTPSVIADNHNHNSYDIIQFGMRIRRKTLFYNMNLIFPLIGISVLAALSFYLPPISGEKITLCTMILLTITVFFVLISESVPPTSLVIPIIDQYLIISFLLIIVSVFSSVVVLNFHFRSSKTDKPMPDYMKVIFLDFLPKILFMERPVRNEMVDNLSKDFKKFLPDVENPVRPQAREHSRKWSKENIQNCLQKLSKCLKKENVDVELMDLCSDIKPPRKPYLEEAKIMISQIAKNFMKDTEAEKIGNDWKYVAIVIDRLILLIFCIICTLVAMITCLQAPILYDHSLPINESLYNDSNLNILFFRQL